MFWGLYREGSEVAEKAERPLPLRALIHAVGQNPSFWPVLRLGIAMSAFQFTLTAHVIAFMATGLGLGLVVAASLFAGVQFAGMPGRVLLPWLSDRLWPGRRVQSFGVVSLLGVGAAAVLASLPVDVPLPMIAPALVALGLFGIGWFPLYLLQVAESAPKGSIASTIAFATTLCMVVMALGPFAFGLVVDYLGYAAAWVMLILPVVVTAVPLLGFRPRLPA
jgi:sugar phosphate permease